MIKITLLNYLLFIKIKVVREYGCDNLYDGDVVKVKGYNDSFKVSVYDNNTMTYLPYI